MKINTIFTLIMFFKFSLAFAQNGKFTSIVDKDIDKNNQKFIDIFKDIHQNPELGFMETRTANIISKELKSYGFDVKTGIGITGVAAILKNGKGPVVMYRADMDSNSVKETTNLPYKSTKIVKKDDGSETPVMHACGHDAHTTWMLAVARFMSEHKNLWKGTLVMIGQPAEEPILGAEKMVKDGLYTKYGVPEPDYLFGIHTAPVAVGMIAADSGVRMAGTDQLDVTFHGIGGHGSSPHLSKDPIIMSANAIMNYQAIVSRGIDPKNSAVITVGSVQAGSDNNVIPDKSLLKINLRWFNEKDRSIMINGIKRINESIAYSYNLPTDLYPEIKMKGWSYPLDNDKELTEVIRDGIKNNIKTKAILTEIDLPSVMGSEDFHHLAVHNKVKRYSYINVGIAEPSRFEKAFKNGKLPFNNHNGDFEVDLSAIEYGSKIGTISILSIFDKYKD